MPGLAAKRSPTSFWTIATQVVTRGSSATVRRMTVAATPYGRLATTFVGAGSSARDVELHRVGEVERGVGVRVERVAQRGLERAVELDHVDVAHARGEVLAEHAEAAADLEHDVVGLQLRGARDDLEDVRVDQEVLAEVALRAHPEGPHAPQARLDGQLGARSPAEEAGGVPVHGGLELLVGDALALGHEARGVDDERRLVAVLAHGLRREVGRVGLDQDAVERRRSAAKASSRALG